MEDWDAYNLLQNIRTQLIDWIMSNPKTNENISGSNVKMLFHCDVYDGLTIDLTRFDEGYYLKVFAYADREKHIQAFIRKVLLHVRDCLIQQNYHEMNLKITVVSKQRTETKSYLLIEK